MSEQMELAVVTAQNAVQIFTQGGLEELLSGIEREVRAVQLDVSTAAGREVIRSLAYKVVRTKTGLDAEAKQLTEGWRTATAKVNAERKRGAERLEALAEEVRKPLTEFETKEKVRVAAHEEALREITGLHAMIAAYPDMSLDLLVDHQRDLANMLPGYRWEEFEQRATLARAECEKYIAARVEARKKFEVEREELERLRKAETERLQRERDEKLKAEAAETARLEAERKAKSEADAEAKRVIEAAETERRRVEAEARRVREDHEKQQREAEASRKREELAKLAAEQRAKDEQAKRQLSEERAANELRAAQEKAVRDAEAATQRERDRAEAERKAEEAATKKREENAKLRAKIQREMAEDLESVLGKEWGNIVAEALLSGKVRHVKVVF